MVARIGIDEVGRGCLAGPVTVAAVLIPLRFKYPAKLPELRDSKLMTRLQRETWHEWIREEGIAKGIIVAVANAMPATIDKINISAAANLAAWRALNKILKRLKERNNLRANIILDGNLFLKSRTFQNNGKFPCDLLSAETIIGADRKFREVKLAAIMAKVTRDAHMRKVAKKYPKFGFEHHKGYGTREHLKAIKRDNFIEGFHRKTFLPR